MVFQNCVNRCLERGHTHHLFCCRRRWKLYCSQPTRDGTRVVLRGRATSSPQFSILRSRSISCRKSIRPSLQTTLQTDTDRHRRRDETRHDAGTSASASVTREYSEYMTMSIVAKCTVHGHHAAVADQPEHFAASLELDARALSQRVSNTIIFVAGQRNSTLG